MAEEILAEATYPTPAVVLGPRAEDRDGTETLRSFAVSSRSLGQAQGRRQGWRKRRVGGAA